MATTRKNPINPFKVASRMIKSSTGRAKTAIKNTQKTSTRKTTSSSSAPVTGKSRVNTKLMDAATKNLPNVTVKAKKQPVKNIKGVTVKPKGKGGGYLSLGGMTRQKMSALPAMDSATFVNTIRNAPASPKAGAPFTGSAGQKYGANSKDMAMRQMKAAQKKYGPGTRFKDFKYDKQTGSYVFTAY